MTLMMTSARVVETSVNVTNNSPSRDYSHPDDQTKQTTETPGFKSFTRLYSIWLIVKYKRQDVGSTSTGPRKRSQYKPKWQFIFIRFRTLNNIYIYTDLDFAGATVCNNALRIFASSMLWSLSLWRHGILLRNEHFSPTQYYLKKL